MVRLVFKDFRGWHTNDFKNVTLTQVSFDSHPSTAKAFVFFGHVNLDFDGSPTAYGPAKLNPDDALGNAGNKDQGWFGVASAATDDPLVKNETVKIDTTATGFITDGKVKFPVVQQAKNGDPKPDFYVSSTPHPKGQWYRQNSYVDASKIAFGALDRFLQRDHGIKLGDFGLAVRHDQHRECGFYFVDMGGWNQALGECSHKVGLELGVTKIKSGKWDNNFPVSFIVFPRSAWAESSWTQLNEELIKKALRPLLFELSQAENANDLPMLMAVNEGGPGGIARGKQGLDTFLKIKGAHARNYGTVKAALALYGFRTWFHPKPSLIF